ncbi:MAG: hypothetical protein OQK46_02370 [Gammaproteobacteria bacterium]|nr:hypothetical protein [Gammaproteobacteria bacterium]
MNNEKQAVKQALKTFYANKSLSGSQLQSLQQKLTSQFTKDDENITNDKKISIIKCLGSIAASFLIVWMLAYLHTPQLISSAYADIQKDKNLNTGLPLAIQQWLDENKITRVPSQYPVEMSKFCTLDQNLTMHMRIAGKQQGMLNVFFYHGERPLFWFNGTGKLDDLNWRLLKVRENLTLIVFYTHDMREKSVLHILNEMLPEIEV